MFRLFRLHLFYLCLPQKGTGGNIIIYLLLFGLFTFASLLKPLLVSETDWQTFLSQALSKCLCHITVGFTVYSCFGFFSSDYNIWIFLALKRYKIQRYYKYIIHPKNKLKEGKIQEFGEKSIFFKTAIAPFSI